MTGRKIIFRDCSIQHMSCLMPIYAELKSRGFDSEIQTIDVPRKEQLRQFILKHKDDPYDLLLTGSVGRETFIPIDTTDPEFCKKQRARSIFVQHGMGGEETPHWEYSDFKAVFLIGQHWFDLFYKLMKNIYQIGYPKLDIIHQPDKRREVARKLRDKLDLPFDQTVLYAPTLRRLDSFDETAPHLLKMFENLDVNLLIKSHCDDEDENHQPSQHLAVKKKAESMKNVRWIGGTYPDITPFYLISDTVVSASSGCLREYMLIDKPSIQLTNVAPKVQKKFGYEGCVKSTIKTLRQDILHALYVPEWLQEEREVEVKRLFSGPDGRAAYRTVVKIREIMGW